MNPTPSPEFPGFVLESQIRECFGRTVYSHKTHEKCADIYLGRRALLTLIQIGLSSVTTAGLIAIMVNDELITKVFTTVFSTALVGINAYLKQYDLTDLVNKHANTASKLLDARETYLSLLTDLKSGALSFEEACKQRDRLQKMTVTIHQSAPRTLPKAYKASQRALKQDEELTFSEAEIDVMLPKPLRRTELKSNAES